MRIFYVVVLSLFAFGVASAEESPVTLPIHRLHMDQAAKVAQAAISACRAKGLNVAVTVVDRGGHPQAVLRDTLAMPITAEISQHKAYAALNFNSPTSQLEGRFTGPASPAKLPGLITSAGGVPISAGGTIIGGVGVSGAPDGKDDEECARAGLNAILADLEMAL
ncbi:MAG: heme-binding protein [Gammaproteobacteria bacterium]|nr:heme-binding protein [Gammaproteobacteria bacterium]